MFSGFVQYKKRRFSINSSKAVINIRSSQMNIYAEFLLFI